MTKEDVNESAVFQNEEYCERRITNMEDALDRFDENLEVFKNNWPQIHKQLGMYEPESELVFLDNGEPDLVFRGISLYNGVGAYTFAREQIDAYWKKPHKLYTNMPSLTSLDKHSGAALSRSIEKIGRSIKFNAQNAFRDYEKSYYLYLLGIGLGVHMQELLETTQARVMLLIEGNFDFLYFSLYVCDWSSFFKLAKKRKVKIELIPASDAQQIANSFGAIIRTYNPVGVDGTIIYQHYTSSSYKNAYDIFTNKVFKMVLMGLGFFEDELYMISHSYENLSSGKSKTIRRIDDKLLSSFPVIIVANGPSLDSNFEYLRKIQNNAIIISCGTVIDAILSEGIKPDFHIQMERTRSGLQLYKYTAKHHDLSSVCLVASTTICPGISDLFGETVYFFRPGLSSMPVFLIDEQERLVNPDPTVANAALALAFHFSFHDIYFFGVDVGAKSTTHHHSKKSLYGTKHDDLPSYMDTDTHTAMPDSFKIETPANFGGTVLTNDILSWTKANIEGSISQHKTGIHFHNCSDGALIEGAIPLLPSRVKIPDTLLKKEKVISDVIKKIPIYDRETFDTKWKETDIYNRLEKMADDLIATLDEFPNLEDLRYSTLMMAYLKPSNSEDGVAMIYRGSVFLYQIAMHYYLNRAQTQEMVEKVREIYREELTNLICTIRDDASAYFKDVESGSIDYSTGD